MVAPLKQVVTVGAEGRIEIRRSQLPVGSKAEVTVLPVAPQTGTSIEALDALQRSLSLDAAGAERWAEQVRTERHSFPRAP